MIGQAIKYLGHKPGQRQINTREMSLAGGVLGTSLNSVNHACAFSQM